MVLRGLDALGKAQRGAVVTIGNFDGVHLGHRKIIEAVLEEARISGSPTVAVTFDPHPVKVLNPSHPLKLLTPPEEKARLLMRYGIDHVLFIGFTREFAAQEPDSFIEDVLVGRLGAGCVIVGHGYAFGKGKRGTTEMLRRRGAKHGFRVRVIRNAMAQGRPVSSSRIRAKISAGRIDLAGDLLGRPYSLSGTVVAGAGRGGPVLNTPTANLSLQAEAVVPKTGVYAVKVVLGAKVYDGAANIGENPTFASPGVPSPLSVEVHILDFEGTALGKPLTIHFVERIRDEEAFPGPAALKARIRDDIARIREVLRAFDETLVAR